MTKSIQHIELKFRVTSPRDLPDKYATTVPDLDRIKRDYCDKWTGDGPLPRVRGLEFYTFSQAPTIAQSPIVEPQSQLTAEQLIAAFTLDAPVPIRRLYGLYGSRTTFHEWEKAGLRVRPVPGMGNTVVPSEFKKFLLVLRGDLDSAALGEEGQKKFLVDRATKPDRPS